MKLIPFGVLSALVLGVFSFMFFVQRHDCPVDESDEFVYNTLWNSFLSTFSSFVGDPPTARNWLDILFGVVMIIVLLNVVIAIVNQVRLIVRPEHLNMNEDNMSNSKIHQIRWGPSYISLSVVFAGR